MIVRTLAPGGYRDLCSAFEADVEYSDGRGTIGGHEGASIIAALGDGWQEREFDMVIDDAIRLRGCRFLDATPDAPFRYLKQERY